MNSDLAAQLAVTLAEHAEAMGDPANLIPGGAGEPLQISVMIRELSTARSQMLYGQDDVRYADATLLVYQLGSVVPVKDDIVAISSGQHAGSWRVLGVESQDAVSIVLRLRRSDRTNAAAAGARITR